MPPSYKTSTKLKKQQKRPDRVNQTKKARQKRPDRRTNPPNKQKISAQNKKLNKNKKTLQTQHEKTVQEAKQHLKKYKSRRCIAKTINNKQCTRRTKRSQYCHIHLKCIKNLEIKPSKIPGGGLGLFTTKNIIIPPGKKGMIIDRYAGKLLDDEPIFGAYAVRLANGQFIDGINPTSSAARFSNSCHKKDKKICKSNNAELIEEIINGKPAVQLVAIKNIYCDKEQPNNNEKDKTTYKGKKNKISSIKGKNKHIKRQNKNIRETAPNNEIYTDYGKTYGYF